MITGITRIAKESIFTGMNNLKVVTTTSDRYATAFGFTEEEVFDALDDMGFSSEKEDVKKWYDGFTFGNCTDIYNPWSIASFIENNGKYENYWADTSLNGLVNSLILNENACGDSCRRFLYSQISLRLSSRNSDYYATKSDTGSVYKIA